MSTTHFNRQGWGVLDQCQITGTPSFYLKLCTARHDNFLAFFVGLQSSTLPTPAQVQQDQLPDILPGDEILTGQGFNPLISQVVDAGNNPVLANVDELLQVRIGTRMYLAVRSCPPSTDAIIRNSNSRWAIVPKDRIITADTCTQGGVPCSPAFGADFGQGLYFLLEAFGQQFEIPAGPSFDNDNWEFTEDPHFTLDVSLDWAPCCLDDVTVEVASDSDFISAPVNATIPNGTPSVQLQFPVDTQVAVAPFSGCYTITLRTDNCGSQALGGCIQFTN